MLNAWMVGKHRRDDDDGGHGIQKTAHDQQKHIDDQQQHYRAVGQIGHEVGDHLGDLFEGHEGGEHCGGAQQEGSNAVEDSGGHKSFIQVLPVGYTNRDMMMEYTTETAAASVGVKKPE